MTSTAEALQPEGFRDRARTVLRDHALGRSLVLLLGAAGIVALPFAVYWKNLSDFFMLDDFIWLKAAAGHGFFDLMRRETSFSTPLDPYDYPTPYIRPLVDAYFWVTWRIFGFDPRAYHALAIAMHGIVGLAVAALGWQLTRSRTAAIVAGLLFVIMPVYDFAVTWVSEATDLIYSLFYLLSLALLFLHLGQGRGRKWPYLLSLAAFTLALLAKEPAITLAPVACLAVLARTERFDRDTLRSRALDLIPYLLLAGAFYLKFYRHEQSGLSGAGFFGLDSRFFSNYWHYLEWVTFPFGNPTDPSAIRVATALLFLATGALAALRRDRVLAFLFLWTLITLVPLSFLNQGMDPRYTYLTSAAFALLLVAALDKALRALIRRSQIAALALAGALAVSAPFLVREVRQDQDPWHAQAVYFRDMYTQVPALCGALPSDSRILIVGSPLFDWTGLGTQTAMNFRYRRVATRLYSSLRGVDESVTAGAACIVTYEAGRYVRTN